MPDPILPDLRASVVRAAARRSRTPLLAAACALLLLAAGATAALRGGDDRETAAGETTSASAFAVFERPAGPFDRLPQPGGRRALERLHGTPTATVRRIPLWGGHVGYASRGGGKICVWAGLGSGCASEREAERKGLVVADPSRIYAPPGRVVVAGLVPDRVRRVDILGLRRGKSVARQRVRNNTFRANLDYVEGIAAYTLIEDDDADQWSLQTLPSGRRLAQRPLRDCPEPYDVGGAWQVDGIVPCSYVGEHIKRHFEPHPAPYTLDRNGYVCRVPRLKPNDQGWLVSCTDGYRRFAFRFA